MGKIAASAAVASLFGMWCERRYLADSSAMQQAYWDVRHCQGYPESIVEGPSGEEYLLPAIINDWREQDILVPNQEVVEGVSESRLVDGMPS
jgi:hypothetical protein